jgi:LPXTG-motif cell wall-anchored protein
VNQPPSGKESVLKIRRAVAMVGVAFLLTIVIGGPAFAASVSMIDFDFVPGTITINAGDTVTWTNNATDAHTATADDGSFDSGTVDPGASFSKTFNTPGTIAYHCSFHQSLGMVGTIVVNAVTTTTPASTSPGETTTGEPLPNTGASSSLGPIVWIGLAFLVAGGAVLLSLRRRRA